MKKGECPNCKKKIDYLIKSICGCQNYHLKKNGKYKKTKFLVFDSSEYDNERFEGHTYELCCPKCGSTLFTVEAEALRFLNN